MEPTPFGRYRLMEWLGRSGMGQVWRAFDAETNRVVAVKVLPPEAGDDPSVTPAEGSGVIDGQRYVDLGPIEAVDLHAVLDSGPPAPAWTPVSRPPQYGHPQPPWPPQPGPPPRRRRTGLLIPVGVLATVILVAIAATVGFLVIRGAKESAVAGDDGPGGPTAIRVTSDELIQKPGTTEPKVVLALYEDFLCPHCRSFEEQFGATITELIEDGSVAADYYFVAILDSPSRGNYSSRAGAAAYCVADESVDAFRRFHAALYAQQPSEVGETMPTNADLIEKARQSGADVADCVNSGKYLPMVEKMVTATAIDSTPTVRINGADYTPTTPEALADEVRGLAG